jgi:hypothetical protein
MISKINQRKVSNFYNVVAGMQISRNKTIGLLVIKKEELSDISALAVNSNLVTIIDLTKESDAEQTINQLADDMRVGRIALMRIHDYLDPKIYNQLFLLAKDGHMEYPRLEERVFVDAAQNAQVILVSTDAELEKLNYFNIFDIVGIAERL